MQRVLVHFRKVGLEWPFHLLVLSNHRRDIPVAEALAENQPTKQMRRCLNPVFLERHVCESAGLLVICNQELVRAFGESNSRQLALSEPLSVFKNFYFDEIIDGEVIRRESPSRTLKFKPLHKFQLLGILRGSRLAKALVLYVRGAAEGTPCFPCSDVQ